MKNLLLVIIVFFLFQYSQSQTYYSFPTDTAEWNCLYWWQCSPNDFHLENSSYLLQGDTILNSVLYNKVYYSFPIESQVFGLIEYIGGLREDTSKNIFFFPSSDLTSHLYLFNFPNDSSEHLLYTFNSIDSGMVLPINSDVTEITVRGVDSILIGNSFRKRYKIEQTNLLFGDNYWIEGIGSTKDLLIPFTYEFEWHFYTLCFTDTSTYYINSPNGEDSCIYRIPIGINEIQDDKFSLYPNPADESINIKLRFEYKEGIIRIYNSMGQQIIKKDIKGTGSKLNLKGIDSGLYIVEIEMGKVKYYKKFVKK